MRKEHLQSRHISLTLTKKISSFCRLLILILAAAVVSTQAQQLTARPDRGMSGKGGHQTTDIDSISLQNGSVNVQIPLASLPPIAGGKLSYTLTASYNSKLWDSHQKEEMVQPNTPGCPTSYSTEDIQQAEYGGGWHVGGDYQVFFRDAHEDYDYILPSSQTCGGYEYFLTQGKFFKPMLRMPDGSEHELRVSSGYPLNSNYSYYQGYERDHLKGYLRYTGSSQMSSTTSLRLHTIDGTYLSVVVNPFTSEYPSSWTIYTKDGTQIQPVTGGQQTKDTNGNSILKGYRTVNGTSEQFVKDEQTGREIKWSSTTYNEQNATKVEYQTVGGTWQTTTVVWGTTTVQGKLYYKQDWNPNGGETGGGDACYRHEEINQYEGSMSVIREIIFPVTEQTVAPQKFTFGYNSDTSSQTTDQNIRFTCNNGNQPAAYTRTASNGLGELSDVTTPTGAHIKYHYKRDGVHYLAYLLQDAASFILTDTVTSKEVIHDGTTDTWTYDISFYGAKSATGGSVTNPDGSVHSEFYNPTDITFSGNGGADGMGGLLVKTNESGKVITEKKWTLLGGVGIALGSPSSTVGINSAVDTEFTTLLDDAGNRVKTSAKKFQYDYNGELTQTIEYDWYTPPTDPLTIPTNAVVLRTVNNSYYNEAANAASSNAYQNRTIGTSTVILGAPRLTSVGESSTRFSYDGQAFETAPTKGNVTTVGAWNNTDNTWINSNSTYDSYGNVITKTDPKGNTTQIFYEDSTHVMPTKTIVDPQNSTGQQIATTTYDFSTGAILTSTDINGNTTSIDYTNHLLGAVDPFARPGTAYSPYINFNGVNQRLSSKTYYEDNARRTRVESDLYVENDAINKTRGSRDQMGRTVLTERNENGANAYTISSETIYNTPADHTMMTSNPHRSASSSTDGWTRVKSDILGRGIEAATFSGAAAPPLTGTAGGNWTGSVTTAYSTNTTTVTDQAGKKRRSVANALGQITRVDEPNDAGQLDVSGAPAQYSNYTYNVLGNLIGVSQGVQTRTFEYDSLSRLKQATNPESGMIKYTYDINGNLQTKRDARGIKTIYEYDNLNRVLKRCYRNIGTSAPLGMTTCAPSSEPLESNSPEITYAYDNVAHAKGRLTKVTTGTSPAILSITDYQTFDTLGRVTQSQQTTDGTTYDAQTYKYNLSGALIEETYPSGRVVKNVLGSDGDLSIVQSKKNANSGYWNYAQHFDYTAAGSVNSMQLGNGKWESTIFNSRLQPTQIALGTVQNGTDKLKLNYTYNTVTNSVNNADNNGNLLSQTITVPAETRNNTTYAAFTATQTYAYDTLNRLQSATETIPNQTGWQQTFTYDRYGNRNFNESATTATATFLKGCPNNTVCDADRKFQNPEIEPSTNRLKEYQDTDSIKDYEFDSAGNTKKNASGLTFIYDGENKQIEVKNASNVSIGKYFYDGDGKRVKKETATETTIFVYNAGGQLVAEYSTQTSSTPQVSYLTSDHLGSPRINTDQNGQVISRHDYQPFGEEIHPMSGNTARTGYNTDEVRKQFTGYERDTETNLDFAQARMYANMLGRFTTTDPLYLEFGRLRYPQAWNLFAYSRNNPLKFVDPSGLDVKVNCQTTKEKTQACQDQTTTDLNNRKDGKFKVEIKNGKLSVVGKVDVSKLSKSEKELYNAITSTYTHSTLNVALSSNEITFGRADAAGENSIDLSDLSKLNASGNSTFSGEVIAHETVEGFESSLDTMDEEDLGKSYQDTGQFRRSHANANQYFGDVSLTLPDAAGLAGAKTSSREALYNFGRIGSVTVTKKFNSAIPIASITSANFPNLVGDIDKAVVPKDPVKPKEKP